MKKLFLFSLLGAFVLVIAASLSAQSNGCPVRANIPFDFDAGSTHFSAGEYDVSAIDSQGALAIVGRDSESALVNSRRAQSSSPSARTKLIFHQYGGSYFLYQIWVEGESSGRELPKTKLEKELVSNATASPIVIMAQK
jgi:hypothetical protein